MSRLSPLTVEGLGAEQRAVYEAIRSGPRGDMGLAGPFGVYVRVPRVGNATQALGAAVRFGTELPENVKEVAILTVGAQYQAKFEFSAHARLGRAAGVEPAVIESLRRGEAPSFADPAEEIAYRVARALLVQHRIDDATYAAARERLGENQLVELVLTTGYYGLVSMTLNAFEIPLREGMEDPFPDLP
jgi:4-carboxymuconolactone decarboxylase